MCGGGDVGGGGEKRDKGRYRGEENGTKRYGRKRRKNERGQRTERRIEENREKEREEGGGRQKKTGRILARPLHYNHQTTHTVIASWDWSGVSPSASPHINLT